MKDNKVKIISVFNNKGGVGKTILTFHLAWALSEIGKKVLLIDLDPQCNLTISGISTEEIHGIWEEENDFIENFDRAKNNITKGEFETLNKKVRTIHYILKPTEDGVGDLEELPPPKELSHNLHILPGRLTLHKYEDAISKRWSDVFTDEPLSIRTATKIRSLINEYANKYNYDIALVASPYTQV
jgi:cellulose biosynthesis protein BcsQ